MKKIKQFIKYYYFLLFLILIGIIVVSYMPQGSFRGDEATYSLIAKEGLAYHSYLISHWKGGLWFEKPPLLIWLTQLSFSFFGISETSAHVFPGILAIISAIVIYFIAKELFGNKLAGFFSGFVFLSSPIIVMYSRTNMTDISVGAFVALSMLSIWQILKGKEKWWLVLGVSMGLAIMTKSVIGFFPLVILPIVWGFSGKPKIFKNNYWKYGAIIFLVIVLPWHIFMSIRFGTEFWKDYLGFHIIDRFTSQILPYPWEGNSPWGYVKLFFTRSGIWFYLFLALTIAVIYNWKKGTASFLNNKKNWIFIYAWFLAVTIPFFLSVTKLPNYMILAYYPMSVAVGGFLYYFFQNYNWKSFVFLCLISFLNFLPVFRFYASDFGEAQFLIPKILIRLGKFNDHTLIVLMILMMVGTSALLFLWRKNAKLVKIAGFLVIISMNMLVPFHPYRNEFIKNMGKDLSDFSKNQPIELYVKMKEDQYSFHCVGAYYLPLKSKIENLEKREAQILPKNSSQNTFCFFEKSFLSKKISKEAIFSYPEGVLTHCVVEN